MPNYNQRYKDRDPADTVKVVSEFFTKSGFTIEPILVEQESSNTWSARLKLTYKGNLVVAQNGKGSSKEFCLASAYAELYERYCNKMYCINNTLESKLLLDSSYSKHGYYFNKDEKIMSFEDCFNTSAAGCDFLKSLSHAGKNQMKEYFDLFCNGKYIGVPYQSISSDDKIYIDPRVSLFITGSSGMAAGNNFYEAFVQAMSEVYEHYVSGRYFLDDFPTYYCLNFENITNPVLQNIIQKIQEQNYLYIFDMSYLYNCPVMLSVAVNKQSHAIFANMGASPIVDIAIERVLTELYQGFYSFESAKSGGPQPYKGKYDYRFKDLYWSGNSQGTLPTFPEHILTRAKYVDYNKNVFLPAEDFTNEELYEYYKKLNIANGMGIYYYNYSACEDMYAIRLYEVNKSYLLFNYANAVDVDLAKVYDICISYLQMINHYIETRQVNTSEMQSVIQKWRKLNKLELIYCDFLIFSNHLIIYQSLSGSIFLEMADAMLQNPYEAFLKPESDFVFIKMRNDAKVYEAFNKYVILRRYVDTNLYDPDELVDILNVLHLNISIQDIDNLNDVEYNIKNIVFCEIDNMLDGYYDDYFNILSNWYNYQ